MTVEICESHSVQHLKHSYSTMKGRNICCSIISEFKSILFKWMSLCGGYVLDESEGSTNSVVYLHQGLSPQVACLLVYLNMLCMHKNLTNLLFSVPWTTTTAAPRSKPSSNKISEGPLKNVRKRRKIVRTYFQRFCVASKIAGRRKIRPNESDPTCSKFTPKLLTTLDKDVLIWISAALPDRCCWSRCWTSLSKPVWHLKSWTSTEDPT